MKIYEHSGARYTCLLVVLCIYFSLSLKFTGCTDYKNGNTKIGKMYAEFLNVPQIYGTIGKYKISN